MLWPYWWDLLEWRRRLEVIFFGGRRQTVGDEVVHEPVRTKLELYLLSVGLDWGRKRGPHLYKFNLL